MGTEDNLRKFEQVVNGIKPKEIAVGSRVNISREFLRSDGVQRPDPFPDGGIVTKIFRLGRDLFAVVDWLKYPSDADETLDARTFHISNLRHHEG